MIKEFNTSTAAATTDSKGGYGTIIILGVLLIGGYLIYRHLEAEKAKNPQEKE